MSVYGGACEGKGCSSLAAELDVEPGVSRITLLRAPAGWVMSPFEIVVDAVPSPVE